MSDTAPRNPTHAAQRIADALLRSVSGTTALLRVAGTNTDSSHSELGILATPFADVLISPALMRKLRPAWQEGGQSKWELLLSATSIEQHLGALSLSSAQALFSMALAVTVAGQDYLIESIGSSEAFGRIYLYRLLLREARQEAL
jgi:hypothetical protein